MKKSRMCAWDDEETSEKWMKSGEIRGKMKKNADLCNFLGGSDVKCHRVSSDFVVEIGNPWLIYVVKNVMVAISPLRFTNIPLVC